MKGATKNERSKPEIKSRRSPNGDEGVGDQESGLVIGLLSQQARGQRERERKRGPY